ncbi:MAG: tetratricopeptide repeat protein [Rhodocyclaceae bacterium]|nr:tetratricopeptide repeat protein [Rhodocyclaceae bacterium]
MKPIALALLALAGLAAAPLPAQETRAVRSTAETPPAGVLPRVPLTPKLLQQFLLAEIAAQRGEASQGAEIFRALAQETRDPRLARRAAELALSARRLELASEAARLWLELDPESRQARQMLVSLYAAQGRIADLKAEVARLLAAEPEFLKQNLLHLNRIFARAQDRQAVRGLIEAVTAPYLDHPEAHFARAQAALDARDTPAARAAIRRARELKPDWELAVLFEAQLLDDRDAALALFADFLASYPKAREVRLTYARVLVNEKRYAEARRQFSALLEGVDPAEHGDVVFAVAILSLQLGDSQEAERQLRKLVEIGHAEADKARYYLGQLAEEAKRWDEALKWFGEVGRGEHYLPARLHAANVLAKQGKLEAARQLLATSEAGSPQERAQLVIGEAQLLREAGRFAEAHAVLALALERQPDQPELLYEIALIAEKLGRLDELETRLKRLIALKPDHAHAHNALGYSLADRNVRLEEARALIERALELAPDDPFILDSKGWVLFRQGDKVGALEYLNKALSLRSDPEIAAHLGEVLWSLDRRDEARATWEKARREHPNNEVLNATIKRFLP